MNGIGITINMENLYFIGDSITTIAINKAATINHNSINIDWNIIVDISNYYVIAGINIRFVVIT